MRLHVTMKKEQLYKVTHCAGQKLKSEAIHSKQYIVLVLTICMPELKEVFQGLIPLST